MNSGQKWFATKKEGMQMTMMKAYKRSPALENSTWYILGVTVWSARASHVVDFYHHLTKWAAIEVIEGTE